MEVFNNCNQVENWSQFIKDGDMDSLSRIYFQYYDLLYTYGLKITSDSQTIEDSIQNIFLSCIKSRKKITAVRSLTGYLISSFRRELFNNLEKKRKIIFTADMNSEKFDFYKTQEQDTIEKDELEKLHHIIKRCIGNLTFKQQEILYLRYNSEISYEEIAQMLDMSIDSCYKSVYRAIKTIREESERIIKDNGSLIFFVVCSVLYNEESCIGN